MGWGGDREAGGRQKKGGAGAGAPSWAPVSEPGFLDFQIFRFSILEICFVCIFLKNMLVRYRGINNKGVLERPGTK